MLVFDYIALIWPLYRAPVGCELVFKLCVANGYSGLNSSFFAIQDQQVSTH